MKRLPTQKAKEKDFGHTAGVYMLRAERNSSIFLGISFDLARAYARDLQLLEVGAHKHKGLQTSYKALAKSERSSLSTAAEKRRRAKAATILRFQVLKELSLPKHLAPSQAISRLEECLLKQRQRLRKRSLVKVLMTHRHRHLRMKINAWRSVSKMLTRLRIKRAAVQIQSALRGMKGRKRARKRRAWLSTLGRRRYGPWLATALQSRLRARLARRRAQLLREQRPLEEAAKRIQRHVRWRKAERSRRRRRNAGEIQLDPHTNAVAIQRAFRGFRAREHIKSHKVELEQSREAAEILQRAWFRFRRKRRNVARGVLHQWARWYLTRKRVAFLIRAHPAATMIQKAWRRLYSMYLYGALVERFSLERRKGAIEMQRLWRGHFDRVIVSRLVRRRTQNAAAQKIQQAIRLHLARTALRRRYLDALKDKVAVHIQCAARRKLARNCAVRMRHFRRRDTAVRRLQLFWRKTEFREIMRRRKMKGKTGACQECYHRNAHYFFFGTYRALCADCLPKVRRWLCQTSGAENDIRAGVERRIETDLSDRPRIETRALRRYAFTLFAAFFHEDDQRFRPVSFRRRSKKRPHRFSKYAINDFAPKGTRTGANQEVKADWRHYLVKQVRVGIVPMISRETYAKAATEAALAPAQLLVDYFWRRNRCDAIADAWRRAQLRKLRRYGVCSICSLRIQYVHERAKLPENADSREEETYEDASIEKMPVPDASTKALSSRFQKGDFQRNIRPSQVVRSDGTLFCLRCAAIVRSCSVLRTKYEYKRLIRVELERSAALAIAKFYRKANFRLQFDRIVQRTKIRRSLGATVIQSCARMYLTKMTASVLQLCFLYCKNVVQSSLRTSKAAVAAAVILTNLPTYLLPRRWRGILPPELTHRHMSLVASHKSARCLQYRLRQLVRELKTNRFRELKDMDFEDFRSYVFIVETNAATSLQATWRRYRAMKAFAVSITMRRLSSKLSTEVTDLQSIQARQEKRWRRLRHRLSQRTLTAADLVIVASKCSKDRRAARLNLEFNESVGDTRATARQVMKLRVSAVVTNRVDQEFSALRKAVCVALKDLDSGTRKPLRMLIQPLKVVVEGKTIPNSNTDVKLTWCDRSEVVYHGVEIQTRSSSSDNEGAFERKKMVKPLRQDIHVLDVPTVVHQDEILRLNVGIEVAEFGVSAELPFSKLCENLGTALKVPLGRNQSLEVEVEMLFALEQRERMHAHNVVKDILVDVVDAAVEASLAESCPQLRVSILNSFRTSKSVSSSVEILIAQVFWNSQPVGDALVRPTKGQKTDFVLEIPRSQLLRRSVPRESAFDDSINGALDLEVEFRPWRLSTVTAPSSRSTINSERRVWRFHLKGRRLYLPRRRRFDVDIDRGRRVGIRVELRNLATPNFVHVEHTARSLLKNVLATALSGALAPHVELRVLCVSNVPRQVAKKWLGGPESALALEVSTEKFENGESRTAGEKKRRVLRRYFATEAMKAHLQNEGGTDEEECEEGITLFFQLERTDREKPPKQSCDDGVKVFVPQDQATQETTALHLSLIQGHFRTEIESENEVESDTDDDVEEWIPVSVVGVSEIGANHLLLQPTNRDVTLPLTEPFEPTVSRCPAGAAKRLSPGEIHVRVARALVPRELQEVAVALGAPQPVLCVEIIDLQSLRRHCGAYIVLNAGGSACGRTRPCLFDMTWELETWRLELEFGGARKCNGVKPLELCDDQERRERLLAALKRLHLSFDVFTPAGVYMGTARVPDGSWRRLPIHYLALPFKPDTNGTGNVHSQNDVVDEQAKRGGAIGVALNIVQTDFEVPELEKDCQQGDDRVMEKGKTLAFPGRKQERSKNIQKRGPVVSSRILEVASERTSTTGPPPPPPPPPPVLSPTSSSSSSSSSKANRPEIEGIEAKETAFELQETAEEREADSPSTMQESPSEAESDGGWTTDSESYTVEGESNETGTEDVSFLPNFPVCGSSLLLQVINAKNLLCNDEAPHFVRVLWCSKYVGRTMDATKVGQPTWNGEKFLLPIPAAVSSALSRSAEKKAFAERRRQLRQKRNEKRQLRRAELQLSSLHNEGVAEDVSDDEASSSESETDADVEEAVGNLSLLLEVRTGSQLFNGVVHLYGQQLLASCYKRDDVRVRATVHHQIFPPKEAGGKGGDALTRLRRLRAQVRQGGVPVQGRLGLKLFYIDSEEEQELINSAAELRKLPVGKSARHEVTPEPSEVPSRRKRAADAWAKAQRRRSFSRECLLDSFAIHEYKLTVLYAEGLSRADLFGESDPYAVVSIVDAKGGRRQLLRTPPVFECLDPVFRNAQVTVPAAPIFSLPPTATVLLELFDHDTVGHHDFLGCVTLDASLLQELTNSVRVFPLQMLPSEVPCYEGATLANGKLVGGVVAVTGHVALAPERMPRFGLQVKGCRGLSKVSGKREILVFWDGEEIGRVEAADQCKADLLELPIPLQRDIESRFGQNHSRTDSDDDVADGEGLTTNETGLRSNGDLEKVDAVENKANSRQPSPSPRSFFKRVFGIKSPPPRIVALPDPEPLSLEAPATQKPLSPDPAPRCLHPMRRRISRDAPPPEYVPRLRLEVWETVDEKDATFLGQVAFSNALSPLIILGDSAFYQASNPQGSLERDVASAAVTARLVPRDCDDQRYHTTARASGTVSFVLHILDVTPQVSQWLRRVMVFEKWHRVRVLSASDLPRGDVSVAVYCNDVCVGESSVIPDTRHPVWGGAVFFAASPESIPQDRAFSQYPKLLKHCKPSSAIEESHVQDTALVFDFGVLRIERVECKELLNTEMFGKQDPYVRLFWGGQCRTTSTKDEGGADVAWDDEVLFFDVTRSHIHCKPTLAIQVWESNLTYDRLIGKADLDLSHLDRNGVQPMKFDAELKPDRSKFDARSTAGRFSCFVSLVGSRGVRPLFGPSGDKVEWWQLFPPLPRKTPLEIVVEVSHGKQQVGKAAFREGAPYQDLKLLPASWKHKWSPSLSDDSVLSNSLTETPNDLPGMLACRVDAFEHKIDALANAVEVDSGGNGPLPSNGLYPRRRLQLIVERAVDLGSGHAAVGTCDPYVQVFWNRHIVGRTPVALRTSNPAWDASFELAVPAEPYLHIATPEIRLVIFDYDIARKDRFLGCAVIKDAVVDVDQHHESEKRADQLGDESDQDCTDARKISRVWKLPIRRRPWVPTDSAVAVSGTLIVRTILHEETDFSSTLNIGAAVPYPVTTIVQISNGYALPPREVPRGLFGGQRERNVVAVIRAPRVGAQACGRPIAQTREALATLNPVWTDELFAFPSVSSAILNRVGNGKLAELGTSADDLELAILDVSGNKHTIESAETIGHVRLGSEVLRQQRPYQMDLSLNAENPEESGRVGLRVHHGTAEPPTTVPSLVGEGSLRLRLHVCSLSITNGRDCYNDLQWTAQIVSGGREVHRIDQNTDQGSGLVVYLPRQPSEKELRLFWRQELPKLRRGDSNDHAEHTPWLPLVLRLYRGTKTGSDLGDFIGEVPISWEFLHSAHMPYLSAMSDDDNLYLSCALDGRLASHSGPTCGIFQSPLLMPSCSELDTSLSPPMAYRVKLAERLHFRARVECLPGLITPHLQPRVLPESCVSRLHVSLLSVTRVGAPEAVDVLIDLRDCERNPLCGLSASTIMTTAPVDTLKSTLDFPGDRRNCVLSVAVLVGDKQLGSTTLPWSLLSRCPAVINDFAIEPSCSKSLQDRATTTIIAMELPALPTSLDADPQEAHSSAAFVSSGIVLTLKLLWEVSAAAAAVAFGVRVDRVRGLLPAGVVGASETFMAPARNTYLAIESVDADNKYSLVTTQELDFKQASGYPCDVQGWAGFCSGGASNGAFTRLRKNILPRRAGSAAKRRPRLRPGQVLLETGADSWAVAVGDSAQNEANAFACLSHDRNKRYMLRVSDAGKPDNAKVEQAQRFTRTYLSRRKDFVFRYAMNYAKKRTHAATRVQRLYRRRLALKLLSAAFEMNLQKDREQSSARCIQQCFRRYKALQRFQSLVESRARRLDAAAEKERLALEKERLERSLRIRLRVSDLTFSRAFTSRSPDLEAVVWCCGHEVERVSGVADATSRTTPIWNWPDELTWLWDPYPVLSSLSTEQWHSLETLQEAKVYEPRSEEGEAGKNESRREVKSGENSEGVVRLGTTGPAPQETIETNALQQTIIANVQETSKLSNVEGMASFKRGYVILRNIEAKGLRNLELHGKQDPYVRVVLGSLIARSTTKWNAGSNCVWGGESLELEDVSGDMLSVPLVVEVWEENVLPDKLIGTTSLYPPSLIDVRDAEAPLRFSKSLGCKDVEGSTGIISFDIQIEDESATDDADLSPRDFREGALRIFELEAEGLVSPTEQIRYVRVSFGKIVTCSRAVEGAGCDVEWPDEELRLEPVRRSELQRRKVMLEVHDAKTFARDRLVGTAEFDASRLLEAFRDNSDVHFTLKLSSSGGNARLHGRAKLESGNVLSEADFGKGWLQLSNFAARDLRARQKWISRPYIKVKIGATEQRTAALEDGGSDIDWSDIVELDVTRTLLRSSRQIVVEVWDEDADEMIAGAVMALEPLFHAFRRQELPLRHEIQLVAESPEGGGGLSRLITNSREENAGVVLFDAWLLKEPPEKLDSKDFLSGDLCVSSMRLAPLHPELQKDQLFVRFRLGDKVVASSKRKETATWPNEELRVRFLERDDLRRLDGIRVEIWAEKPLLRNQVLLGSGTVEVAPLLTRAREKNPRVAMECSIVPYGSLDFGATTFCASVWLNKDTQRLYEGEFCSGNLCVARARVKLLNSPGKGAFFGAFKTYSLTISHETCKTSASFSSQTPDEAGVFAWEGDIVELEQISRKNLEEKPSVAIELVSLSSSRGKTVVDRCHLSTSALLISAVGKWQAVVDQLLIDTRGAALATLSLTMWLRPPDISAARNAMPRRHTFPVSRSICQRTSSLLPLLSLAIEFRDKRRRVPSVWAVLGAYGLLCVLCANEDNEKPEAFLSNFRPVLDESRCTAYVNEEHTLGRALRHPQRTFLALRHLDVSTGVDEITVAGDESVAMGREEAVGQCSVQLQSQCALPLPEIPLPPMCPARRAALQGTRQTTSWLGQAYAWPESSTSDSASDAIEVIFAELFDRVWLVVVCRPMLLRIVSARDLRNLDTFGESDPYVTVDWGHRRLGRTRTIDNTLAPNFGGSDDDCVFDLLPTGLGDDCSLELTVYDSDAATSDDIMGRLSLGVDELTGLRREHRRNLNEVTGLHTDDYHRLKVDFLLSGPTEDATATDDGERETPWGVISIVVELDDSDEAEDFEQRRRASSRQAERLRREAENYARFCLTPSDVVWQELQTENGRSFWYNEITHETQWERPRLEPSYFFNSNGRRVFSIPRNHVAEISDMQEEQDSSILLDTNGAPGSEPSDQSIFLETI